MSLKDNHIKTSSNDGVSLCKISDLTNACDCLDNLRISIYLTEKEKFIYYNSALEKIVGSYSSKILNKNWDFWFSLIAEEELVLVKNKIKNFFFLPYFNAPFLIKYHIINEYGKRLFLRHEILLHRLENQILAINYFFDITEKEKIEGYFKQAESGYNYRETESIISPREKEVLRLVADGFSSKQIADQLFISNHTAISHRKNLIEKFNVKNTAQLIKRAYQNIELW